MTGTRIRPWRWLGLALLALVGAVLLLHVWYAGNIWWWRTHPVGETAFMSYRMDELRDRHATAIAAAEARQKAKGKGPAPPARLPEPVLRYQWVPYERISPHLKRAMIAAEDAKFVDHEGFDWDGIQKALEKNEKRGRVVAGGSTITQQLAKNLFLSPSRSYLRKAEEAVITLMLEAMLDKRRIFEIYLNVIELGSGVFGAEAAARRYFNVSAAQLSPEQAARLAAMAPNPRFYERNPGAPGLNRKIGIILARMPASEVP
jgi:monofunctional biosynthetic peptidoglycan transglycosylase